MTAVAFRPAGDQALLLVPESRDHLAWVMTTLANCTLTGVQDMLPAAETVLLTLAAGADPSAVEQAIRAQLGEPGSTRPGREHPSSEVDIPVRYDGEDLADVADLLGISIDQVVDRHQCQVWRCRFVGFTAGFGYLEPEVDDESVALIVPRRPQSRTAVPAGAVALADGYSAVYPRRAPGGWQLIGTTDSPMWDLSHPQPAVLVPGTRVRFVREDR